MLTFPFFRMLPFFSPDAGGGSEESMDAGGDARQSGQDAPQAQNAQIPQPQAEGQAAPETPGPAAGDQRAEPDTQRAPEGGQKTEETPETLREQMTAMKARLGESQLRTAAALAGVSRGRIPYVLRMADVSGIDPDAQDAADRYQQAVDKVLTDLPELRGNAAGTGSVGNFARRQPEDPDAERIRRNILG